MSKVKYSALDKRIVKQVEKLTGADWRELIELTVEVIIHKGSFSTLEGGEVLTDGTIMIPHTVEASIVTQLRDFFYKNELVVNFDWVNWEEGRRLFNSQWDNNFEEVSLPVVIKLFIAVIRNDRFCEGAFAGIFDSGDAEKLLRRLLQFNKVEYTTSRDWMLDNLRLHNPPSPEFIVPPEVTKAAEKELLDDTCEENAK